MEMTLMRISYPNLMRGLLVGLFCLLSTSTLSQSTLEPLFLRFDDTLWQWTETDGLEEVVALPADRLSSSLSPTQHLLVYERYTESVLAECFDDQGNGLGCGGPNKFPTNIYAIDLRTGETMIIAGSPDSTLGEPGRSRPVWSPDGTRLAWTEGYDYASLYVHDFLSNETVHIADNIVTRALPGVSATVEIAAWCDAGIVFQREIVDADTGDLRQGYLVYDPADGNLLIDSPPLASSIGRYFASYDHTDAIFTDREYLNLQTGEILPTPAGILARYAHGGQDTSLRVYPSVLDENGVYHNAIYSAGGDLLTTLEDIDPYVFSPTGTAIAYRSADGITVWRPESNGGPFEIPLSQPLEWVLWGARSGYGFVPGGEAFIAGARCEDSMLPFRLRRDDMGYVLGDISNNVRATPGAGGEIIGQLAPGVPFAVVAGPICSDGLAWWEVDDPSGWTAEGQGDVYWLQPGCPESSCAR
jgi:hypothetical protein